MGNFFVIDDGGMYNVFSDEDFDSKGRYLQNPEYNIADMEIVKRFNNADAAFNYADKMNDSLYESKKKKHNSPKDEMAAMKHADWEMNKDNYIKGGSHKTSRKDKENKPKYKKNYADSLDESVDRIVSNVIRKFLKENNNK